MARSLTGKVHVGEIIEPPWSGDSGSAMRVVGGLMTYIGRYGLDLNISDHFYPKNQCPLIDGISADVWWERYVGSTEVVRNESDCTFNTVIEGTILRRTVEGRG
jgi:hypothetical protein